MKRISGALLLLLIAYMIMATTGCVLRTVTGSGDLETRDMELSGFSTVIVSHAFDVEIAEADSYSVRITTDDNLFEYLSVKTSGSTLFISLVSGNYIRTTQKATITMPDLRDLRLSGASDVEISGFRSSHSVDFHLSGASHVSGDIEMGDSKLSLSGASRIELEGSADDITIGASGASDVRLADLSVVNAKVNLSGASDASVNASGRLDGSLSGASGLEYRGSPTLGSISASGGSTIGSQ